MVKLVQRYECPKCEKLYENEKEAVICCALPSLLYDPDIERLKKFVQNYMKELAGGDHPKDIDHYSYEILMETFYGKSIFKWINKQEE